MMLTLGPWVPGQRTTIELLPAPWLFGDNDDYQGGRTLETDPIFGIEAHLTRDLTETLWGSIDAAWFTGGESAVDEPRADAAGEDDRGRGCMHDRADLRS